MRLIDADKLMQMIPTEEYNARMAITYAPTVDAEPVRHGRWLSYEFATNNRWRKCSVCGTADEYINEYGTEAIRNYCPFCGAKIDEVEDAE